jgi:hypothetical protein
VEELGTKGNIDSFVEECGAFENASLSKEENYLGGLYFGSESLNRAGISIADFDFKTFSEACYLAWEGKEVEFTEEEMKTFTKDYTDAKSQAKSKEK